MSYMDARKPLCLVFYEPLELVRREKISAILIGAGYDRFDGRDQCDGYGARRDGIPAESRSRRDWAVQISGFRQPVSQQAAALAGPCLAAASIELI